MVQHQQPVREALDGFHDVFDDQDADALVAHLADDFDHFLDFHVVEPGHDFVAQQQLRFHGQCLGEFQAFAVRTAQCFGPLVDAVTQADEFQAGARRFTRGLEPMLAAIASEQGAHTHVVQHA